MKCLQPLNDKSYDAACDVRNEFGREKKWNSKESGEEEKTDERRRKPMREEKAKGGESRGREWENLERDSKIEKKRKTNISE